MAGTPKAGRIRAPIMLGCTMQGNDEVGTLWGQQIKMQMERMDGVEDWARIMHAKCEEHFTRANQNCHVLDARDKAMEEAIKLQKDGLKHCIAKVAALEQHIQEQDKKHARSEAIYFEKNAQMENKILHLYTINVNLIRAMDPAKMHAVPRIQPLKFTHGAAVQSADPIEE